MTSYRTPAPGLLHLTKTADSVVGAIVKAGGHPIIVGGSIRDALLTLAVPNVKTFPTPKDIDIEVHGLVDPKLLVDKLSTVGTTFHRGTFFPITAVHAEGEDFDVSVAPSVQSTSEENVISALSRRDFTINSMAWDPQTQELVDPFNGRVDMQNGVLRHTSELFSDDPLRVLRGMQFAGRFGFAFAPETLAVCEQLAREIEQIGGIEKVISAERIWEEWRKLARRGDHMVSALTALRLSGWLRFFPELEATIGVEQDIRWHAEGDVWTHLSLAAEEAARAATRDALSDTDREVAVFGALVHDFGKVTHTRFEDDRITSRGHAAAGVEPALAFLSRIGAPQSLADRVGPVVREHMSHIGIGQPTRSQVRRLMRRLGGRASLRDWARVVDADCLGRGVSAKESPASLWLDVARDVSVELTPRAGFLTGNHLISAGLTPGPEFAAILHAALDAQDDGDIYDQGSALDWFGHWQRLQSVYPRNLILAGIVGSTAYDLNTADSDRDYLGLFFFSAEELLGLDRPQESIVSHEPDAQFHELAKFLNLALKCNPTASELLWLERYEVRTEWGDRLVDLRSAFLSESLVRGSFLGYASAQCEAWQKRVASQATSNASPPPADDGRLAKNKRHMFRVLEQGHRLNVTGDLHLRVENRDWYLEILPTLSDEAVLAEFRRRAQDFQDSASVLPEEPQREAVNSFLIEARKSFLG